MATANSGFHGRTMAKYARQTTVSSALLPRRLLKHLGLWHVKTRPPPRPHSPPAELYADYSDSQIPPWDNDCSDTDYLLKPICKKGPPGKTGEACKKIPYKS